MNLAGDFGDYQTQARMQKKVAVIPLPDLHGKTVLDVGCDHGWWCQLARNRGAARVIGVDRGREVKGKGFVDIVARNRVAMPDCEFQRLEIGRQYDMLGRFDVVLMLNMYHHAYNVAGDHESIWFWLHCNTAADGELIVELPVDTTDGVASKDIHPELHAGYTQRAIFEAADRYFEVADVGTGWRPTRRVWRCRPRMVMEHCFASVKSGAGGASKAFAYADERRCKEIDIALGFYPVPGSLNLEAKKPFDWSRKYFRTQILDVVNRKAGLASAWAPRWCRFYPLNVEGVRAYAMRFENERFSSGKPYPETLIELIAGKRLRDSTAGEPWQNGDEVCLAR